MEAGPTHSGRPGPTHTDHGETRSFSAKFEREQSQPFPWKAVVKRAVVVLVAGVALYLVAPEVIDVFHAWPRLATLSRVWLVIAVVAQVAHFACTFALQRIALRTKEWFPVVTAQLAGNSISLIVPGGAAAGAAVQFRMLAVSGMNAADAAGGLTAFSLLGVAGLLMLPLLVLPIVLFGSPVNASLADLAVVGAVAFVLFAGFGAWVLAADAPIRWSGRLVQMVHDRLFRKRKPLEDLSGKLLEQRNLIRAVLGRQWWQATLLSAGRLGLDFLCLLGSVRAVGSHARPSLVLLAYAIAGVIGLIPITPGGLGIVEAGLSGLLVLAGLTGGEAVLATLAYRLASYWLPLLAGPVAYWLFRYRYHTAGGPPAPTPAESAP